MRPLFTAATRARLARIWWFRGLNSAWIVAWVLKYLRRWVGLRDTSGISPSEGSSA